MVRRIQNVHYWSLGNATVRNPNRIKGALRIIKKFYEGKPNFSGNTPQQAEFFENLVKYTPEGDLYDPRKSISEPIYSYLNKKELSMEKEEYKAKNGRVWLSVIEDFGFINAYSSEKVKVYEPGNLILKYDFLEGFIWLKQLLKYQIPNPSTKLKENGEISPPLLIFNMMLKFNGLTKFEIGLCQLQRDHNTEYLESFIKKLRSKSKNRTEFKQILKEKSILRYFSNVFNEKIEILKRIYVSVIKNKPPFNRTIEEIANDLNDVVRSSKGPNTSRAKECKKEIKKLLRNNEIDFKKYKQQLVNYFLLLKGDTAFKDYVDLTIRYLSMSQILIKKRVNGRLRFNISKDYQKVIKDHIDNYTGLFRYNDNIEFINYYINIDLPELLIDNEEYLKIEIESLKVNLKQLNVDFKQDLNKLTKDIENKYKSKIIYGFLKTILKKRKEIEFASSLNDDNVLNQLENLSKSIRDYNPMDLEYYIWKTFLLLGGYTCHPSETRSFNVDDDFNIMFTAPGNVPDLKFPYNKLNIVIEVTKNTGKTQWRAESEPVPRHIAVYSLKNPNIETLGLFIAPSIHEDTWSTFFSYSKGAPVIIKFPDPNNERESVPIEVNINIVPLTLKQFYNFYKYSIIQEGVRYENFNNKLIELSHLINDSENENIWRTNISSFIQDLHD